MRCTAGRRLQLLLAGLRCLLRSTAQHWPLPAASACVYTPTLLQASTAPARRARQGTAAPAAPPTRPPWTLLFPASTTSLAARRVLCVLCASGRQRDECSLKFASAGCHVGVLSKGMALQQCSKGAPLCLAGSPCVPSHRLQACDLGFDVPYPRNVAGWVDDPTGSFDRVNFTAVRQGPPAGSCRHAPTEWLLRVASLYPLACLLALSCATAQILRMIWWHMLKHPAPPKARAVPRWQGGVGSRTPVSVAQCALACKAAPGCEMFTYNSVLQQCFLKVGVKGGGRWVVWRQCWCWCSRWVVVRHLPLDPSSLKVG